VNGVGSLPPPSSIPGLGVLMGGRVSWMGSVGKTLGELRDNPTYVFSCLFDFFSITRSRFDLVPWVSLSPLLVYCDADVMYFCIQLHQKSLLSDVSQSIVSAWNAPTTPIGSAPPISRKLSTPRFYPPPFLTAITTYAYQTL
jgi:hypothetical protein